MKDIFKVRRKVYRIALRTSDIAKLLGIAESTIGTWIQRKKLVFTGDPIKDLYSLLKLMKDRNVLLPE